MAKKDNLLEFVLDRINHPKYGVLTWERDRGTDVIRKGGKIAKTGEREQIANMWRSLKSATAAAGTKPAPQAGSKIREDIPPNADEISTDEIPDSTRRVEPANASTVYDWVSSFDIKEVQTAIDQIVEYLPEIVEDGEQTHLLRNDVRMLDNLLAALKQRKPDAISKMWNICATNGAAEHLHDEFCAKMAQCSNSSIRSESFGQHVTSPTGVYTSLESWKADCSKYRCDVVESGAGSFHDAYNASTGELVGSWNKEIGWLAEFDSEQGNTTLKSKFSFGDIPEAEFREKSIAQLVQQRNDGTLSSSEFIKQIDQLEDWIVANAPSSTQSEWHLFDESLREYDEDDDDFEVDPEFVQQLTAQYTSGEITFAQFKDKLESAEYTDRSMRRGEMGMYDGDTASGHAAWRREQRDWDMEDEREYRESAIPRKSFRKIAVESAPPDQEQWVQANKQEFTKRYGEKRGTEILYATAWKRHNASQK